MGKRYRHGSPNRVMITLNDGLRARVEKKAEENNLTVEEYILHLLDTNCPIINYSLDIQSGVLGAK